MGQLRSSVDVFKSGVCNWVSKVMQRGYADIWQPLTRSGHPAESPEAYKLYADYQERIHELNQLIGWLRRAVAQAQQDLGAVAFERPVMGGRLEVVLLPLDPRTVRRPGPPLDAIETRMGVHRMAVTRSNGSIDHVPVVDPNTFSVSSPMYQAVLNLVRQKAEQHERLAALKAGPAVTLD